MCVCVCVCACVCTLPCSTKREHKLLIHHHKGAHVVKVAVGQENYSQAGQSKEEQNGQHTDRHLTHVVVGSARLATVANGKVVVFEALIAQLACIALAASRRGDVVVRAPFFSWGRATLEYERRLVA